MPALDRGLFYGQSVFETIAIVKGRPALLDEHLTRLQLGCKKVEINIDISDISSEIKAICSNLDELNLILRVMVSMGAGGRGYQNPERQRPIRVMSLHEYPKISSDSGIFAGLSDVCLAHQPLLAGIKHGNRLEQILARQSWMDGWQEALVRDYEGNLIEGTQSNLFIVKENKVQTPLIDRCGVEGVMRNWVLDQLKVSGFSCSAVRLSLNDIIAADGVFLTNSIRGIQSVCKLQINDKNFIYSKSYIANRLQNTLLTHDLIPSI